VLSVQRDNQTEGGNDCEHFITNTKAIYTHETVQILMDIQHCLAGCNGSRGHTVK